MKWMGTEHDQNKQYSSQTESNASEGNGKQSNRRSATPNLPETLALCYLAMMLLRLPTSIGDIHRWAIREDIPYVRAIRHVPDVIKQKLPAEYDNALDTISSVEPDDIRRAIHRTIIFYRQYFDLSLPALNFPLLLFKHVRNLGLPGKRQPRNLEALLKFSVNILSAVDCTAKLLSIEFRFPDLDLGRQSPVHLPEISLLSLIVIAVKLLCPFEAPPQFVESLNDPATLTINWLEWAQAQKEHKERLSDENHLPRGSEMQVTERDVLHMSDEQIDEYLDWYEKTFIDEERARVKKGAMAKQLLDMFPTGAARETPQESYHIQEYSEQERESLAKLIRQVHSSLGARFVMTRDQQGNCDKSQAVGSCYRQYRHPTDLTAHARIFHQAVADAGAIRLETLVRAVRQMERRLLRWCEHQKREHGWQSLSEPNHVRHRSSLETTGGSDMSDEDSDHVWEAEREDAARTTMDDLSDPGSPADVRSASSSGDEMSS